MNKSRETERQIFEYGSLSSGQLAEALKNLDRITESVYRSLFQGDYNKTVNLMKDRGKALERVHQCLARKKKDGNDGPEIAGGGRSIMLQVRLSTEQVQRAISEARMRIAGELRTLRRRRELTKAYKQES